MLYRIQCEADENGMITPDRVQIFDAPFIIDPVTDRPRRSDPRQVKIPLAMRQALCDWINQRAGGLSKYQDRLAAERADFQQGFPNGIIG